MLKRQTSKRRGYYVATAVGNLECLKLLVEVALRGTEIDDKSRQHLRVELTPSSHKILVDAAQLKVSEVSSKDSADHYLPSRQNAIIRCNEGRILN